MEFHELSDYEWEVIKPLLPPRSRVGKPRADDRRIINGILYVLTTGCRWMDMPLEYGSYKTAWRRASNNSINNNSPKIRNFEMSS